VDAQGVPVVAAGVTNAKRNLAQAPALQRRERIEEAGSIATAGQVVAAALNEASGNEAHPWPLANPSGRFGCGTKSIRLEVVS
jgi:hypothetical protein